jgi:predicted nucleic acid-binding protein
VDPEKRFTAQTFDLEDLRTLALLENRKRSGRGELSTIAFAMRFGTAVLTDDQKARKFASHEGHAVQTTPHLFSWLIFKGDLGDSDKFVVISEHCALDGILKKFLEDAYLLALECRLASTSSAN